MTSTSGYLGNAQITLTIPPYTLPTISAVADYATAPNYNNGKITTTVNGGQAPFNYFFSGLNAMTTGAISSNPYVRTGLVGNNDTQANYGVFVMDSRNCQSNIVSGIRVLNKLTVTTQLVSYCNNNSSSPMIVANVQGGHGNYIYEWRVAGQNNLIGSTSSAALTGVAAGNYTLVVKDGSTPQQIFPQPPAAPLTVTMPSTAPAIHTVSLSVANATNGLNNGSVNVTTTSGLGPYTYTYTPGTTFSGVLSNTHSRTGLAPGSYSVGVKTNYGCNVNKSFTIQKSLKSDTLLKQ